MLRLWEEPIVQTIYHIHGVSANDALPLEHKLLNRQPLRQADVADFIGDAALQRYLRVDEGHLKEQPVHLTSSESAVPSPSAKS